MAGDVDTDSLPDRTGEPRKTVLVTGHKGQLGHALMELLQPDYRVAGVDLDEMDITRVEEVASTFYLHHPDIVIHTAAWTDVDGCELEPEKAIRVNSLGTQNLVIAAEEFNSVFVYLSTDYVFPGDSTKPYLECDNIGPLSWYGKSKLLGERYVQDMLFRYFIVRTSWLIGEKGRNFVKIILKMAKEKEELTVVHDQTGCPTFANDLARAIRQLIETPYYGTYHVTNSGETTWYDFAVRILKEAGIATPVRAITSKELGRPAPRPGYSVLSGMLFRERGFAPLRSWEDALVEYLAKLASQP
jgi:dTDP-4-dehydrorhamnose reductase